MLERTTARSRGTTAALVALALGLTGAGCGGEDGGGGNATAPRNATSPPVVTNANVARIPGRSPGDVASAAVLAVYPDAQNQPRGLVFTPQDDWQQAVIAAQFAADPVNAAVLPTAGDYLPSGPADLVERLRPSGFPRGKGLEALVIGKAGDDVFAVLRSRGLELSQLRAKTPPDMVLKAVPFRGGWAARYSDQIVVVSSQHRDFALPGLVWSAYSGDTVAFVGRASIPDATRTLLVQRQKLRLERPAIYLIGPPSAISESVASQLRSYGSVKRVAGPTPAATSVALARYKDRRTGFGWGVRRGPANVTFLNPRDWGNAFGAIALAGAGPRAPVLLTSGSDAVPAELARYLRDLSRTRGNQGFVLGDESSIGGAQLAEIDRMLTPRRPRR